MKRTIYGALLGKEFERFSSPEKGIAIEVILEAGVTKRSAAAMLGISVRSLSQYLRQHQLRMERRVARTEKLLRLLAMSTKRGS